jgi:hypothetical protein
MKSAFAATLGAAALVTVGASSAAQAAIVNFGFGAFDGSIQYTGTSLGDSTALDLDQSFLVVMEINAGDASGLALFDEVSLTAPTAPSSSEIIYGSTPGPLVADVILSWTAGTDTFTETLTAVKSIVTMPSVNPNFIAVSLTGTLTDTGGVFTDSPVLLMFTANQAGGAGQTVTVSFTNTSRVSSIPETSTWAMMALGFGALVYAASRRRKARIATLFA